MTEAANPLSWAFDVEFTENVRTMSGGRIDIELYESPALVPSSEQLDALANDVIQQSIAFTNLWSGKNSAMSLFAQFMFGQTYRQMQTWYFNEGEKYLDMLYGPYNAKAFAFVWLSPEISAFTKSQVNTLDEWRAVESFRAGPGLQNEVLTAVGINAVWVAGTEVYSALERGTIEGAKWGSPAETWGMKFHEVAPYLLFPAWAGSCGATQTYEFNLENWNALSDQDELIIRSAIDHRLNYGAAAYYEAQADYVKLYKDYGCVFSKLPAEDLAVIMDAALGRLSEMADENPLFKEILLSQMNYVNKLYEYELLTTYPALPEGFPPTELK
ncbi:TRAP transporter substrate-binding protein DctP [Chloroflexota bacterium]